MTSNCLFACPSRLCPLIASPRKRTANSESNGLFQTQKKQFLELSEILLAKLGPPFVLDLEEHLQSLGPRGVTTLGKTDNARAAFIRRVGPDQIPELFQTPTC